MSKYSKTPIGFFLDLPIGEFYAWVRVNNEEIKREDEAVKKVHRKGK